MLPLEGIRVLDFSRVLAGPFCSMMLGDLGAEVIKVEEPNIGDETRRYGPPFIKGESSYFLSLNRNKKSLTVNLKSEEGKTIIHRLTPYVDVVIENFRPGVAEKLDIHYAQLKKYHPQLIYCSVSAFGQDGPYREEGGYDNIIQGLSGLMAVTGEKNGPPIKVGIPICDILGAVFSAFAIMAALWIRKEKRIGQWIDISLLDCQVSTLTYWAGRFFATGEVPERMGTGHPQIVPFQAFQTADLYINVAVPNEKLWKKFCNALGREDLSRDPRFCSNENRVKNRSELVFLLQEIFLKKKSSDWVEVLKKEDIPCAPILAIDKVLNDPHVLFRKMVEEIDHPSAGKFRLLGIPYKFSATPAEIRWPPPRLGEHTEEILAEYLRYSPHQIEKLKTDGII